MPRSPACWSLAACSGDGSPAPSTSTTTSTTMPDRFARGQPDGVLTIGVMLPRTGDGASLGDAARRCDRGRGARDEHRRRRERPRRGGPRLRRGRRGQRRRPARRTGIDAIIGPASSRVALSVLPTAPAAGVAACSPTATSIALTGCPTTTSLSHRASDALQARAMANIIDQTGLGSGRARLPRRRLRTTVRGRGSRRL